MPLQCVILAGGRGTRLQSIAPDIPKSLVPVLGRPFLDHQLTQLRAGGVDEVVLCIGCRGAQIRDYVKGKSWGLKIDFVDEGDTQRGTAGALALALPLLHDRFLVTYGDSFLPVSFAHVMRAFEAQPLPVLMTVYPWEDANAWFEKGRVRLYDKAHRDPRMRHLDFGVSAFTRDAVAKDTADLADVFQRYSRDGLLAGLEMQNRFYEVGSPEGIRDFTEALTARRGPLPNTPRAR